MLQRVTSEGERSGGIRFEDFTKHIKSREHAINEMEMVRCPLRLDMERFYAYEKAKEKAEGEGEGEEEGEGEGEGDVEMMMMMMMSGITSPSRGHKLIIYGLVVWDERMAQMGVTI
ncbi:unnamed protein product [Brassica oleracea]